MSVWTAWWRWVVRGVDTGRERRVAIVNSTETMGARCWGSRHGWTRRIHSTWA